MGGLVNFDRYFDCKMIIFFCLVGKPPVGSRDLLDDLSSPTSTLKSLSSTLRSTTKSPSCTLRSTTTRNQYNNVINEQNDISGNSQLYTSANSSYFGGNYSLGDREAAYASPSDYQVGFKIFNCITIKNVLIISNKIGILKKDILK